MTFDDGILTIYKVENTAQPGQMPVEGLTEKDRYYYGFDTLGINRYYTALQAQQQIEAVVNVPGWGDIAATDICALDNGDQFRIVMRQPTLDDNGLRITKLSLERINEKYAINPSEGSGSASDGDG